MELFIFVAVSSLAVRRQRDSPSFSAIRRRMKIVDCRFRRRYHSRRHSLTNNSCQLLQFRLWISTTQKLGMLVNVVHQSHSKFRLVRKLFRHKMSDETRNYERVASTRDKNGEKSLILFKDYLFRVEKKGPNSTQYK